MTRTRYGGPIEGLTQFFLAINIFTYTIASEISVTPKGVYLPISKLHHFGGGGGNIYFAGDGTFVLLPLFSLFLCFYTFISSTYPHLTFQSIANRIPQECDISIFFVIMRPFCLILGAIDILCLIFLNFYANKLAVKLWSLRMIVFGLSEDINISNRYSMHGSLH